MAKNKTKQKKKYKKVQKVLPVNPKAKDTFFKRVYEKEERQRELVSFLLGVSAEKVSVANVRPVLFGNKENDFACMCDGVIAEDGERCRICSAGKCINSVGISAADAGQGDICGSAVR